ncbi:MAG: tRNA (guanine-N(1)-)-methyltransferase [Chlamydiae bacterium]|nr:tRNA (guanine-N(1)-)-methyltransferase [Chlamydiota bacterium]
MKLDVLSLFPHYFKSPLDESMLRLAQEKGFLEIGLVDIRDYCVDRYKQVDDRPYGGGPGMVLRAEPVVKAIRSCRSKATKTLYLSPQGKKLTPKLAKELALEEHLVLLCGHYEGVDERAIQLEVDEEISIGDYVLTNGCLAALVLMDVVCRYIPGVLGHQDSASQDSFESDLLDCPHYTRPQNFEGIEVPSTLLSGNHQKIHEWREQKATEQTLKKRPDLIKR